MSVEGEIDALGRDLERVAEAVEGVVYEQYTANLIAAATATWANGSSIFPQVELKRSEILKRLGLDS